ncbi:MAG: hypothetical protein Q4E28_02510 [Clostridia bacterium]|nr:hypothetical protein [Clostridia bacterium]
MKEENIIKKAAIAFATSLGATLLTFNFHYLVNKLPKVVNFADDTLNQLIEIHPNRQKSKKQIKEEKEQRKKVLKEKKARIHREAVEIYEKRKASGYYGDTSKANEQTKNIK